MVVMNKKENNMSSKRKKPEFGDAGQLRNWPVNTVSKWLRKTFMPKTNNKVKGTVSIKPAWVHTSRKGGAR